MKRTQKRLSNVLPKEVELPTNADTVPRKIWEGEGRQWARSSRASWPEVGIILAKTRGILL